MAPSDDARTGPSVEPGSVWRAWWIWTEPGRLVLRLFSEQLFRKRFAPKLVASGVRLAGHLAAGNPWWSVPLLVCWRFGFPLLVAVGCGLTVEAALLVWRRRLGRPSLLALYRLGVKFHRVWARVWSDAAAKSANIQDREGGGGGESRASVIRPVVDHPRLPWRFWVRWPVITFRVGVPPGRSFSQFERVMAQMSANIPWIHAVELEYLTDRSSFGLLHVSMHDVLARISRPAWASGLTTTETNNNNNDDGGPGAGHEEEVA